MNEDLKRELMEAIQNIKKLEAETNTAVKNMDEKIRESRDEKAKKVLAFIREQFSLLEMVGMRSGERLTILCCGDDWEGKPNACGSFHRDMGISFNSNMDGEKRCVVGRYFSGSDCIDECAIIKANRTVLQYPRVWNQFIDRWGDYEREKVEKAVTAFCRSSLERRTKEAADKLECANKKYAEYFGGEEKK